MAVLAIVLPPAMLICEMIAVTQAAEASMKGGGASY